MARRMTGSSIFTASAPLPISMPTRMVMPSLSRYEPGSS